MILLTAAEFEIIRLSLWVAGWAVIISLPFGIAAAWLLSRRQFFGKTLFDGIIHAPLVLPPVAIGFGLLVFFGRTGIIGARLHEHFGITVAFTWKGAALASAVMAFPLMVRAIRLSLDNIDSGLEQAAATLGASPWRVFITISLPLALPGLLSGSILAFARSMGEFGATITFVSNIPGETRTLPLALYSAIQTPGGEWEAMRLCVMALILALLALVGSELLARQIARRLRS